jgi:hypothetical protein
MRPLHRPVSAGVLLLTLAVLAGGCQDESPREAILFACESDGSCSQQGHVCDSDRLCRPGGKGGGGGGLAQTLPSQEAPLSPRSSFSGRAGGASQSTGPAPQDESAVDRCARRCAQKQGDCTSSCGDGLKCRQHCDAATDACYARCQHIDAVREAARQRSEAAHCMGTDGRPRRCTPAEERALRAAMDEASRMVCRDGSGKQVLCPEQREQLERSKRLASKGCRGADCAGVAQE